MSKAGSDVILGGRWIFHNDTLVLNQIRVLIADHLDMNLSDDDKNDPYATLELGGKSVVCKCASSS